VEASLLFPSFTKLVCLQGPACAIAAGAGTIFRNYCVPMGDGQVGQTRHKQVILRSSVTVLCAGCFHALSNLPSSLGRSVERCEVRPDLLRIQLDGLAQMGALFAQRLGCSLSSLWSMRNGYCMPKVRIRGLPPSLPPPSLPPSLPSSLPQSTPTHVS
jgi:hypothetical protein